jgi:hypothetical protein
MGEEMAHAQSTAAQSPNVKYQAKKGAAGGVPVEMGAPGRAPTTTVNGGRVERLGAKWAPQMLMNSPEVLPSARTTQSNVRIVNSAVGNRDFYLKRQYGQRFQ